MREMIEKAAQKIETALDWTSERRLKCSGDQAISRAAEKKNSCGDVRPCKHRGKISSHRLQGQKPLTPMPPAGGRFTVPERRGDEYQKNTNSASG